MIQVEQLAAFVSRMSFKDLSEMACDQLKLRVLDGLACAFGALDGEPIRLLRLQIDDFGGTDRCSLIGGGKTAPDRAALYNTALVRYLDFNDGYLARGETCHPSDNLGALLAATEYAHGSGQEFLTALAIAYQVQCRLSDEAPVRAKGFDHITLGAYAIAAGVSKALRLDPVQIANAIAISGTAYNALRVTRTGALSHWKGLAYPNTAFGCTHAAFLAMRGVTGPLEVFEGNKGFMEAIAGKFDIDWSREDLERVTRTILKRYNAEIHSQSAIEGILELRIEEHFTLREVETIELDIFDVAYHIIGGGEEGDKTIVRTKEEADHSLPYLLAVALLDGQVMPAQYRPERIQREDVQGLLRRVKVRPSREYSQRFPLVMPCQITIRLLNGRAVTKEKVDYEGFYTHPMSWERVTEKFKRLSDASIDSIRQKKIIDTVSDLDKVQIEDLMALLRG